VSAQKVATGIALAALAALFLGVGLPTLLPPAPVPEIVVPVGEREDQPVNPAVTVPPSRPEGPAGDANDDSDDDVDGSDSDDDDDSSDDSPDGSSDDSSDDDS
jgi:hypothetical protein